MNCRNIATACALAVMALPMAAYAERTIGWQTFSAEITERSALAVGAEYLDGRNIEALDYDGETLNALQLQLNIRLGDRGEAVLGHTALRTLRGGEEEGTSGGDPWFYTKIALWSEQGPRPAAALIWGLLEPAANQPFGADNMAFYAFLAFSQHLTNSVRADLNLGIGIYESDRGDQQDDEVKLNLALWYEPQSAAWGLGAEFNYDEEVTGRWFDFTRGTESEYRRRRIALSGYYGERWQLFGGLSAGWVPQSERFGASAGVRYRF